MIDPIIATIKPEAHSLITQDDFSVSGTLGADTVRRSDMVCAALGFAERAVIYPGHPLDSAPVAAPARMFF